MASDSERAHAQRLIEIHRANLDRLEEKKAKFGIEVPIAIENQIEQERANIAALEPLTKLSPSQKVQEFVNSAGGGQIDLMMLYMQGTQINARVTKQEEETQKIREEQGLAAMWRMQVGEDVAALKQDKAAGESGRRRNLWLLLISIGLSAIALFLVAALVLRFVWR